MEKTTGLKTILRQVPSSGRAPEPGLDQKLVYFNPKTRRVVPRPAFRGTARTYLVTVGKEVELKAPDILLPGGVSDERFRIEVTCRVAIAPEEEAAAVERLAV